VLVLKYGEAPKGADKEADPKTLTGVAVATIALAVLDVPILLTARTRKSYAESVVKPVTV
jgi:hypothetical protein